MSLDRIFDGVDRDVRAALDRALEGRDLDVEDAVIALRRAGRLPPRARAPWPITCAARRSATGSGYVVNRNINFTNVCVKACRFCAFSRTRRSEEGYFLPIEEIVRRALEARTFGATEVCIQAGLAPGMDAALLRGAGTRHQGAPPPTSTCTRSRRRR